MAQVNRWFLAAWLFLVVTVAGAFWIQARTIDALKHQQDQLDAIVARGQAAVTAGDLCLLFLADADSASDRAVIERVFARYDQACPEEPP